MSYILGALKKAEQDRSRSSDVSTLMFASSGAESGLRHGEVRGWKALVVICLSVVLLLLLAYRLLTHQFLSYQSLPHSDSVATIQSTEKITSSSPVTNQDISEASLVVNEPQSPGPTTSSADTVVSSENNQISSAPFPDLNVTGYLYFPDKPDRSKLFIDGVVYRQGSRIRPGLTLKSFRSTAVVYNWKGVDKTVSVR